MKKMIKIFVALMKARRSFLEILSVSYFGTEGGEEMTQKKFAAYYLTWFAIICLYSAIIAIVLSSSAVFLNIFYNADTIKAIASAGLASAIDGMVIFIACKLALWLAFKDEPFLTRGVT